MYNFVNFLQKGLDGSSQRQRSLNNNVANVDTPNYKRKDVDFISTLRKETVTKRKARLLTTDNNHIPFKNSSYQFRGVQANNTSGRNDGNNVEIDHEMAEIAKNNIYYNTLVQQVNSRFQILKNVIDRGGR
ncbi:MAG: flagellar basal body rod protein FlgB [Halanaerobiales bacterium]